MVSKAAKSSQEVDEIGKAFDPLRAINENKETQVNNFETKGLSFNAITQNQMILTRINSYL